MKTSTPPRLATWFLDRYGAQSTTDSAIGDLMEQYQRGRGPAWYWRQALSLVFADFAGDLRRSWGRVLIGLVMGWTSWTFLQFLSAWLLILAHVLRRPDQVVFQVTAEKLFPLVALRWTVGSLPGAPDAEVGLLAVLLHLAALFAVGIALTGYSRVAPQTLVLSFMLTYVMASAVEAMVSMTTPNPLSIVTTLTFYASALILGPIALLVGGGQFRKRALS